MNVSAHELGSLAAAVALAAVGGEVFLKGIVGAARRLRLSNLLVATTLAAFATSSPELTVSSVAALSGAPEIGLGDALGSNVVNIALIFGIALLFGPIRVERAELGRDYALALAVPLLTLWLVADDSVTRLEGALLLGLFGAWIGVVVRAAHAGRAREQPLPDTIARPAVVLSYIVGGLAALVAAGRLFVFGASGIAAAFGVDPYVVGVLVVAIGTSLPELVTVLLARLRGHDDIGVGTLIGSNLFNGLAIVGTAAFIHPIEVPFAEVAATLLAGVLALLLLVPGRVATVGRVRGIMLLSCYATFIMLTVAAGHAVH